MSSKPKKRIKSTFSNTETRTAINLQQLAYKQRSLLVNRPETPSIVPFIKPRGLTPSEQLTSGNILEPGIENFLSIKDDLKSTQSLKTVSSVPENPLYSNYTTQSKLKLTIGIPNSLESFSEISGEKTETLDYETGGFSEYKSEIQKINKKYQDKQCFCQDREAKHKYKIKFKAKIQDLLSKQNEIHEFQIESIKKHYEDKISKYKEIIQKLQQENNRVGHKDLKIKDSDLINPLIEENLWLKKQLNVLKSIKKK
jgi:hypothetical protein